MEKKGWKTLGIIFIVLFVLLLVYTWNLVSSDNKRFDDNTKYYNDNYVFKCGNGLKSICINEHDECYQYNPDTQSYPYICDKGKYNAGCYDQTFQTTTTCNKLDGYTAICMPVGANYIKCPTGAYINCQDTTTGKWVASI